MEDKILINWAKKFVKKIFFNRNWSVIFKKYLFNKIDQTEVVVVESLYF